jgi:hypothetical protein
MFESYDCLADDLQSTIDRKEIRRMEVSLVISFRYLHEP